MLLPKLRRVLKERGLSPEKLAKNKLFSNMTVRRACEGKSISKIIAASIAKELKIKLSELE